MKNPEQKWIFSDFYLPFTMTLIVGRGQSWFKLLHLFFFFAVEQ